MHKNTKTKAAIGFAFLLAASTLTVSPAAFAAPTTGVPAWAGDESNYYPTNAFVIESTPENGAGMGSTRENGFWCAPVSDSFIEDHSAPVQISVMAAFGADGGWYETLDAYNAANGVFSANLFDTPCADAWDLTGDWYMPDHTTPADGLHGSGGLVETPEGWLDSQIDALEGDVQGLSNSRYMFLLRGDGSIVAAQFSTGIEDPAMLSVEVTPKSFVTGVNEALTITSADLLEGATISDPGNVSTLSISVTAPPENGSVTAEGDIEFQSSSVGEFTFRFMATDTATGTVSSEATGVIQVLDATAPLLVASPQNYRVQVGQELSVTLGEITKDAFNVDWNQAVDVENVLIHSFPTGAVLSTDTIPTFSELGGTRYDSNPENSAKTAFTFTSPTPGTYEFTFMLVNDKGAGMSVLTTGYIEVFDVVKPKVTG